MPDRDQPLRQAAPEELERALAHALRFDGCKAFRLSGESIERITAAHLAVCPERSGFVVMWKPPLAVHGDQRWPAGYGWVSEALSLSIPSLPL